MSGININKMDFIINKLKIKELNAKMEELENLNEDNKPTPNFYEDFIENAKVHYGVHTNSDKIYYDLDDYYISYDEQAIRDFCKFIQPYLDFEQQKEYYIFLSDDDFENWGYVIYKNKIMYMEKFWKEIEEVI